MTIEKVPCSILSLDVQDILGSRIENIQGTMRKRKINKEGQELGMEIINNMDNIKTNNGDGDMPDYEYLKKAFQEGKGCNMFGTLQANKVIKDFRL